MTELELKEILEDYMNVEMNSLSSELDDYNYEFSKKFNRRMRRLMWSEKYFGKRIHVGYVVRRVATIILVFLGLFAVDEVSASVMGIHPWQYIWSHINGINMDEKIYTESETQEIGENLYNIEPTYVPDGFSEVISDKENLDNIYIDWENGKSLIQYERVKLKEDTVIVNDAEYTSEEEAVIHGYAAIIRLSESQVQIEWDDNDYNYSIVMTNADEPIMHITKMAESIYEIGHE